jgi:MFS family permease
MAAIAQRSGTYSTPVERANYNHFVWDVAWYGIACAATSRFMQFYAMKMGADAMVLGLIVALPQLILMFATMLSPWWRNRYPDTTMAIVWPALCQRFIFLLPAFTPFFPVSVRVPWLIFAVCLPSIGQGMASTIFLMMMRETITPERLSPLFNRRILMFNVGMMGGALGFGFMLEHVPFPINYSLMFLGAFAFGMLSLWHVIHVKRLEQTRATSTSTMRAVSIVTRRPIKEALCDKRLLSVLLMVIVMHFAQSFISAPLPIHLANLGAKEGFLAVLGMIELAASGLITLLLQHWLKKWGAKRVMIGALMMMSCSAFLTANAPALWVTLIGAALGGASWTCGSIAVLEFYTQRTDRSDVQATMLWHQLLFLSMFVGPMVGSMVVKMGITPFHAMMLGGGLRLICVGIAFFGLAWLDRKASQESKAKYA